ncbi:MAG: hypothetical protein KDD37_09925 [Bdellovibrionales bacterium]|nr:hypothetical protein [Bdellovibrionales bacterium]
MKSLLLILGCSLMCACATYNTADKVSLVSFDDNPTKGKSVGNIRGEDCTWTILGYQLGGLPTVDRAFANARMGVSGGLEAAGFRKAKGNAAIRYVNNVSTKNEGFNAAGLVAKNCIVVSGLGFK